MKLIRYMDALSLIRGLYDIRSYYYGLRARIMGWNICITILLMIVIPTCLQAQPLTGIYTVNAGASASATNFQSFTALAVRLNTDGVVGNVTVNVVPNSGPYEEEVIFQNIPGVDATKRVRINGNGNTLQFKNTTSARAVMRLAGTKYMRVDNLVFKTLDATYGCGVMITGGALYDSITNCRFDLSSVTSTGSSNSAAISFSANVATYSSAGLHGSYCYIGGNHIVGRTDVGGPYYGVWIAAGNSTNISFGNVIENNVFENYQYAAVRLNGGFLEDHRIVNNDMHRATKTTGGIFYGIYTSDGAIPGTQIIGNRIHDPIPLSGTGSLGNAFFGMWLQGDGTAARPVLVANNILYNITQGNMNSIYISGALYNLIYHNTVAITRQFTNTTNNLGWFVAASTNTGTEIKNNLICITAGADGAKKFGFRYADGVNGITTDGNNIWVNSTSTGEQYYAGWGADNVPANNYATRAAFRAAYPGYEANGNEIDPQFVNPDAGNLLPQNMALRETGLNLTSYVPVDIEGNPRHTSPTPGAFEIPVIVGLDAAMLSVPAPAREGIICPGGQQVRAVISNTGIVQISGLELHWSVDGAAQTPYVYTGLLDTFGGSGKTIDTVTIGTATIPAGSHVIKVWTVEPNDQNPVNDTVSITVSTTSFSLTAQDTVCTGSSSGRMLLDPSYGYTNGMIRWERSANGTSFTSIASSDTAVFTDPAAVAGNTWYRVHITQGTGSGCYSDTIKINAAAPSLLSVTGDTICGAGSMTLSAVPAPGSRVRWFSHATGGATLATGNTYTTPVIATTTSYYPAAILGSGGVTSVGPLNPNIGSPAFINGLQVPNNRMTFTVHRATTLVSVDVFPDAGSVGAVATLEIIDTLTSTVVHTVDFKITKGGSFTSGQTVVINKWLTPGTYYLRTSSTVSLARNATGSSYPYASPDLSIVAHGTTTSTSFFYFYNWQVGYGCTGSRQAVQAVVKTPPAISVTADPPAICLGDTSEISVTSANNGYTWQWTQVGGTAATFSVSPAVNTKYVVTATDNSGGVNDGCWRKDSVTLPVHQLPTVSVTTSGPDSFCAGGSVMIMADSDPGNTYQWEADGVAVPPPAGQSATYTADTTGAYRVIVTNANQCSSGSDTINVTSWPLPEPAIIFDDTTMTTGVFDSYEWRRNGTVIPGATDQRYTPDTVSGDYSVTVTDGNGCIATSSVYPYSWTPEDPGDPESVTGIISPEQVRIYPNPAADIVYIGAPLPVNVAVCSPEGKMVLHGSNVRQLSLNGLADGLYFIRVYKAGGVLIKTERLQRIGR